MWHIAPAAPGSPHAFSLSARWGPSANGRFSTAKAPERSRLLRREARDKARHLRRSPARRDVIARVRRVAEGRARQLIVPDTWTRTVALVREHAALRDAIAGDGPVPSVYAAYRFASKLRAYKPLLDACLDRVTTSLPRRDARFQSGVAV